VRGYIVDGGCRDVSFIKALGFPVFCRFTTPRDIVAAWTPEAYNVPIQIGEVDRSRRLYTRRPGRDCILPGTQAEAIVNRVEVVVQTENLVRKAILEGMPPKEGDLQYRKF
jgi:4-hydroxy-4-methyl-2-oxoglutarate aldolase